MKKKRITPGRIPRGGREKKQVFESMNAMQRADHFNITKLVVIVAVMLCTLSLSTCVIFLGAALK